MEIYREEVFGPVLIVLRAGDIDEALRFAKAKASWTAQDLLDNNTDGLGNPLSKVYSRREARRLCRRFRRVDTCVHWLVSKNVPVIGKYLPGPVDRVLGRMFGWALYVMATK